MKKSFYIITSACLALSTFLFFSCATTGGLTGFFSAAGEIASDLGYDKAGAALNVGSQVSKAMEDITPENEYYIGRAVAATVLTNYSTYTDLKQESYLNKICSTLALNSENPEPFNGYHVKVLDTDEVNAFATCGGHIFITRGLLACTDSEDALAAVIAHEMSHIQLKHSLKAIKASRWTEAGISATNLAVTDSKTKSELASSMNDMVSDVILNMVTNGYSKTQEFDADTLALSLMVQAGYNPKAMINMLNGLKSSEKNSLFGMYKTHPSPEARIGNVNSSLKKIKLPADTSSYRKERFAVSM